VPVNLGNLTQCEWAYLLIVEMRVERDWLWQMAVPQLRRWCSEQHSLTLVVIDLPWDFHYAAAPPHHSSSSSSLSAAAAAATAGWQKSLQISEMLRCQTQSIGPDFIVCISLVSFYSSLLIIVLLIIARKNVDAECQHNMRRSVCHPLLFY